MADDSAAIIISATITSSVALVGIIVTVALGSRQQRKTLEETSKQARLTREADAERETRAAAHRRYERVRAIIDPYVALAREMRSTTSAWQLVLAPQTLEGQIALILARVQDAWAAAEVQRGNFEIEPGLDEMRTAFDQLEKAYNVFAGFVGARTIPGWQKIATEKTIEIEADAELLIVVARELMARLDVAQHEPGSITAA
jgi:hypothetical protein